MEGCSGHVVRRGGGEGGPQEVENNYLAERSGAADGEGGRKAKTMVREGDNAVLAYSNSTLRNRGTPLPPGGNRNPENNFQQFAQRACRAPRLAMAFLRRCNPTTKRVAV